MVAGLVRALVETAARGWAGGEPAPDLSTDLIRMASWRASRSGLAGQLLDRTRAGHGLLRMWTRVCSLTCDLHSAPADLDCAVHPVYGDVGRSASLDRVRSLESADFVEKDAGAACGFGEAAAEAGLVRIIYPGGLGRDNQQLPDHQGRRATLSRSSPPRCWGRWWPSSAAPAAMRWRQS